MIEDNTKQHDENELIAQRKAKLVELRKKGQAFPNNFRRDVLANGLHVEYGDKDSAWLEERKVHVKIAGRMMLRRIMGKAGFAQLQDMSGRIQVYLRKNDLPEGMYDEFKTWDLGDIVAVEGYIFKTKTGELSIHVENAYLLTKALRPLPDKFHGLEDKETRYRKRYLDLIVNESSRKVFQIRAQIINEIRSFLAAREFVEVETPMMQVLPGGATARPFVTHHNVLDMPLYLRVAPELYLKRLVVGGLERVFEINRNFRNEGISIQHNPEFTMLEFYQAYADYHDLIDLTEEMLQYLASKILNTTIVQYQGAQIDFSKTFNRMTLKEAILHFNPNVKEKDLDDLVRARAIAEKLEINLQANCGLGKIQLEIFEETVEHNLKSPTFITEYPAEVSPLARRNDENPFVSDRFELFISGREIANGFSELNDPEDQADRFSQQLKEKQAGDMEAMSYDDDYITALEYGLPPTAGEGIGIDRLVMIFTDSPSIRDVILFPHMRHKGHL